MTIPMIIRVEDKIKNRLSCLARAERKATSQVIRELIDHYVEDRDITGYIDDLWSRIRKKITSRGFGQKDIPGIVRQVRSSKN